ncbi:Prenylcysteine lyase-domain-containing protein [Armillaria luteobubalina]|uniref:Prenylcysteine lyase-domain-containing protein n=1 Tax=Armillaria luteobubalina TaxID=153913 RepID=A0AA39QQH5_9AGAR|nr:Prenylcysteine lyase-domain-containing protein [Armillaria luteobubalina]
MRLLGLLIAPALPFKVPFLKNKLDDDVTTPPRIAIIGAGAAGSSAAFWISKAKERFGLDLEVDVYERSSYIGGRALSSISYCYSPVELGGSIFRASDEFNLTRTLFADDDARMGVWDGEQLLVSVGGSWWDTLKLIWKYGVLSPKRTEHVVEQMVKQFLKFYTAESPRWDNMTDLASSLDWTELVSRSTADFFESQHVGKNYVREIIEASTRVNYGQNVDAIHALEGAVSMAAGDAAGIQGGNYQIFEAFLRASNASVYLDTNPYASASQSWTVESDQGSKTYKAVLLAAPFHSTGMTLSPFLTSQVPEQPYVRLHVTLLSTTSPSIDPEYLNLPPTATPPSMLLTTYDGARNGGKEPEFNSISYHGKISDDEWVVKVFSQERKSDEWLRKVFRGQIGWVHRKEWDAYPVLPPTTSFPPVKLDVGFYYINAFEPFISTMETETIASRNVVDLMLNEEFSSSICGPRISASSERQLSLGEYYFPSRYPDNFVLGWDC